MSSKYVQVNLKVRGREIELYEKLKERNIKPSKIFRIGMLRLFQNEIEKIDDIEEKADKWREIAYAAIAGE
jgi:hypothetical protein